MRIAVVGAGIFGVTIALKISSDHDVYLFDTADDILTGASRTNQLRLHRGYHYPRSPETTEALLESITFFIDEYKDAIIDKYDHYYCIANEKSHLTPSQYLNFCEKFKLEYDVIKEFEHVNSDLVGLTVRVKESLLDYQKIYKICCDRLLTSSVRSNLGKKFCRRMVNDYDLIINCTYSNINELLNNDEKREYQFEVCEKIAVNMPAETRDTSIVIMDGPFMCVDPYGQTGMSLLGNVTHAIHHTNTGYEPFIPINLRTVMNKGIIKSPPTTNFDVFIKNGRDYIPSLNRCQYVGSMFTVRAVLPNLDESDARPTIISHFSNNIVNVFSGKIDTCVMAAKILIKELNE